MQDSKNRANRHLIGLGKVLYSHPGILVNGGGDSGDEILGPPGLLSIQVALIICTFSCLHFVNNAVYCGFVKALIPKGKISCFFNLVETFPGSGKPGDEIPDTCHSSGRGG